MKTISKPWKVKQFFIALVCSLLVVLTGAEYAQADVADFRFTDFRSQQYLTKDDRQGELHVVEHFTVVFTDHNHGLLRALPNTYKGHSLQLKVNSVSSSSGAPADYTTYESNGNTVLKIGDADRTVTGQQRYTIDYTYRNVMTFYDDHDELYWDVNGDQWNQPFDHVSVDVYLPAGLKLKGSTCYSGDYGSQTRACTVELPQPDSRQGAVLRFMSRGALQPHQTLTYALSFDRGTFAAPTALDWWQDNGLNVISALLPLLAVGGYGWYWWWRHGRDARGRGTIVPQYEPPDQLSPAEVAAIYQFKVPTSAISATIIDLAIRKYLRIHETKEKKLLQDKLTYRFELLNSDYTGLRPHEVGLMQAIFHDGATDVDLASLKNNIYKQTTKIQRDIPKHLSGSASGYFAANPLLSGIRLYVIGFAALFLASVLHNWVSLGLVAGGLICIVFAILMPRRTAKGVVVLEHTRGLKLYMNVAEKDRIAMLQSPDARYAAGGELPECSVDLFEKLLPYAIVLGVETQWAKQFESIYTTPPDWYSGNWTTFNAIYLASSLDQSMAVMTTAFNPPSNSSGSGFGGGGFSGGGGGGGGGGGW